MDDEENYSLLEAAGYLKYYGGDSRQDVADFITWAKEFEAKNKGRVWDGEYMEEIDAFAKMKMDERSNA